tara:strand:+ start:68336 stop:69100 length:765 start_codon:yes stop_codon:yes gene_type:complete
MNAQPTYVRPTGVEDAISIKASLGAAGIYGCGLTAAQLGWGVKGPEQTIIDIAGLDLGADVCLADSGSMVLAANASLECLRLDPLISRQLPWFAKFLRYVGSTAMRNQASLGGNLLWGAGDLEVLFAAVDAKLRFAGDGRAQSLGPTVSDQPEDLLISIIVPALQGQRIFVEKLGHRQAFSPSRVVVAGCVGRQSARLAVRLAGHPVATVETPWPMNWPLDEALFAGNAAPYLKSAAHNLLRGHLARLAQQDMA